MSKTTPEKLPAIDTTWLGDSRGVSDSASQDGPAGACWVFIKVRMGGVLYGFYPLIERWRVNYIFIVLASFCADSFGNEPQASGYVPGCSGNRILFVRTDPRSFYCLLSVICLPALL